MHAEPTPARPRDHHDPERLALTRDAAARVTAVFHALTSRGTPRDLAQRFTLQCALALLAEGLDLLPRDGLLARLDDLRRGARDDAFPAPLLRPLHATTRLADPAPLDLRPDDLARLAAAAALDWSRVHPAVFGALFQASMDAGRRHALGAHFTSDVDIQRVVTPTIVRPWQQRIDAARTPEQLHDLRAQLARFRVLDPACGAGDFLLVALRELARLEHALLRRLPPPHGPPGVGVHQLFGIDRDPLAVELATITLLLGAPRPRDELPAALAALERNLVCDDALFCAWPPCDAIIGNPPFQSKNKIQRELGPAYVRRVRARYPDVSGRADYCVYWFRRAHDELPAGGRAGLVGTNTIRQNDSRAGGLDHVVATGTITDAVATQVWYGDAAVHVSIVNWIKQPDAPGPKALSWQDGDARDSPWTALTLDRIGASLSPRTDVTAARPLAANASSGRCWQGQTHGHEGFLLAPDEAAELSTDPQNHGLLFPFLNGDDLLGTPDGLPRRFVIDLGERDLPRAREARRLFTRLEATVLPTREAAAADERARNHQLLADDPKARANHHHAHFLASWWILSWRRPEMLAAIAPRTRYVACARVTKRPIFEFVSTRIRPSDALVVFALDDDYSFGVLQSALHWAWFNERCSTLTRRFRYTSNTVFDAFPWPQSPTRPQVRALARAAADLRRLRAALMREHDLSRRELYRALEQPGRSPLKDAHERLDAAARSCYGMPSSADGLRFLLDLNAALADREARGQPIVGPGLPPVAADLHAELVTPDCVGAPA